MIEETKKEIRQRLEGFDVDMIQADVDSWIFGNKTIAKIKELAEEFDEAVVVEVMCEYYLEGSKKVYPFNTHAMSINNIQAKRIVASLTDADGKEYDTSKSIFNESIVELSREVSKLFDELVTPAVEPNERFVKDVDKWIKLIRDMKEKYGVQAFLIMYDTIERIRSLMWAEGFTEEDAAVEVANRQEKEMEELLARRAQRMNQLKSSLNHPRDEIIKMVKEFDASVPGNLNGNHYFTDHHIGMGRALRINTNKGSGGHGYDISTNGSRHKKVVTGKAGNQYPVAKRRGVR